ncbi:MAG: protein-L-isoaspartate(D-aspartate) O-methyltransferase [Verrucomicrobiota bacterium]
MKRLLYLLPSLLLITCSHAEDDATPATSDPTAAHDAARQTMVERQLKAPGRDIKDPRVLKAMAEVPRHEFVPDNLRHEAYRDSPLPIGHKQTISQPFIVALMTEKLDPQPDDKVLEIGTGSGYQAAVLAKLVKDVYSIEIVEPLAKQAEQVLDDLNFDNVHVKAGDGYQGWPEHAPFDAIIVTCAPDHIPQPLIDQLKEGGRMMIPVGPTSFTQELILLEKQDGKIVQKSVLPVRFVPMTGESQQKN